MYGVMALSKASLICYKTTTNSAVRRNLEGVLKFGLSPSKNTPFICFHQSTLKMMKNAFYFMLKDLFVFEIFTFLS